MTTLTPDPEGPPPAADDAECPACREAVRPGAAVCPHCGKLLGGAKTCPQCAEEVRAAARACRFCGYDFISDPLEAFTSAADRQAESQALRHISADPLGGMLCEQSITNLFLQPVISLNRREIVIRRWAWLGLRRSEQKVSLGRVASVRAMRGIFWSSLIIETQGGAMSDLIIQGLNKAESAEMVAEIERVTIHGKSGL